MLDNAAGASGLPIWRNTTRPSKCPQSEAVTGLNNYGKGSFRRRQLPRRCLRSADELNSTLIEFALIGAVSNSRVWSRRALIALEGKMSEYHQRRAQEIVRRLIYITVATTSSAGQPWSSPVYSAFDNWANFYWTSSPLAQHSRNIDENGKAFLAIYDSTVPAGMGEGVYVEAAAGGLVIPEEVNEAKTNLARRIGKQIGPETERLDAGVQRIYRATPKRVWMNGFENDKNGRYLRDVRIELPISCLERLVTW